MVKKKQWGGKRTPGPGKKLGAPTGTREKTGPALERVSFRIDKDIMIGLREYCENKGHTQRWVLEAALSEFIFRNNIDNYNRSVAIKIDDN